MQKTYTMNKTKVRFAPSPTGNLHIGGARTALFNWLYAKATKGEFILRIEDTDQQRSKKEYLDEILHSLKWLQLDWDQLYLQSERSDGYQEYAEKLLKEGQAYRAANLENSDQDAGNKLSGQAIIYKVNPQKVTVNDLIRGEIEFDADLIKDQVLIKSDGSPTYNFACVVDDATMGITHVIRGDDHISNTPKQILLYKALGFDIPKFAHLPLILGKDGTRLSKRTGATAISEFRKLGFLPEALVNFLLLLGWSPGENREIIGIQKAAEMFNIKKTNKTAAIFDSDKLNWINNQYIRNTPVDKLTDLITPMLEKSFPQATADSLNRQRLQGLIKLYQARMNTLADFPTRANFFFSQDIVISQELKKEFFSQDLSKEFALFVEKLECLQLFTVENIETEFRNSVAQLNIKSRQLIHPIRVALTGQTVGPGLFDVIFHLGKDTTKARLGKWIK